MSGRLKASPFHHRPRPIWVHSAGRIITLAALVALAMTLGARANADSSSDFALENGDTLVFLGDSNTAGSKFAQIVENYSLLRYPLRHVQFVNSGRGGDTAEGGAERFQTDVVDKGANHVFVMYGINDICWGFCATTEKLQDFYQGIIDIVMAAETAGITVHLASYPVTGSDPFVDGPLQEMGDTVESIALYLSAVGWDVHYIDVHGDTREIYQEIWTHNQGLSNNEQPIELHTDGIHLNKLGHEAVAFSVIKGMGGPAEVSSVSIGLSAAGPFILENEGASVTSLQGNANLLRFERLDAGLPITFGLFSGLSTLRWIPYSAELNQYMLEVRDLPSGRYSLEVEGRPVGTFSSATLRNGVNLSSQTGNAWQPGGPWDAQATSLAQITQARRSLEVGVDLVRGYVPDNPNLGSIDIQRDQTNERLEGLQRTIVSPTSYTYVLKRESE